MKTVSIVAAVCLCLLAGCASHKLAKASKAKVPDAGQQLEELEAGDDFKIKAAVCGYLLGRHFTDQGEFSAIFIEGSDAEVAALIQKFPNHVPPIKPSNRMQLYPNQAPVDKDTGKPALILGAKAMDPTNGVSEAIGTWYAGEAVSGLYAFVLVKMGGAWTIQSVR